jgi:hypothetical protein
MATRFFANAAVNDPSEDTGTTEKGDRNVNDEAPQWLLYQTATATRPTQANSHVYVSGPDESSQTFYVAIAMSNLVGGGGTPPTTGWPDVAFYGCVTGDTGAVKIAVMNQACGELANRATAGVIEDMNANLATAGFPFSTGGTYSNFAKILNGSGTAGAAGVAGSKLPIIVIENGTVLI